MLQRQSLGEDQALIRHGRNYPSRTSDVRIEPEQPNLTGLSRADGREGRFREGQYSFRPGWEIWIGRG